MPACPVGPADRTGVVIFFTCLDLEQKSSFMDGYYLKEISQKMNPISMAKHTTVPTNVIFNNRDSYFKCMKKRSTTLPFIDAIKIAIHILSIPSSMRDTTMVTAVSPNNTHKTATSLG